MKNLSESLQDMAKNYKSLSKEKKDKFLTQTYVDEEMSTSEIAEWCHTYPNMIRRNLIALGITIRSRSEAQKIALNSGRHTHPTKGKTHSEKTKEKISEAMATSWSNMSAADRQSRVDTAKAQWDAMTDAEQKEFRRKGGVAIRKSAIEGSKLEKYLMEALIGEGFRVDFHTERMIKNEKMQLDLFLPELATAIEIDGPSHFLPIWGADTLAKNQKADAIKNGLLLGMGFCMIRIQQKQTITKKYKRDLLKELVAVLNQIKQKFPANTHRYIILGDK